MKPDILMTLTWTPSTCWPATALPAHMVHTDTENTHQRRTASAFIQSSCVIWTASFVNVMQHVAAIHRIAQFTAKQCDASGFITSSAAPFSTYETVKVLFIIYYNVIVGRHTDDMYLWTIIVMNGSEYTVHFTYNTIHIHNSLSESKNCSEMCSKLMETR